MESKGYLKIKNKALYEMINEQYIPLIQTQRSHIDTQHKIILQIQKELKLIQVRPDNPVGIDEMQELITELIEFIDKLDIEEKK